MKRLRLATAWLAGCSGCHMSLLNLHMQLLEILKEFDLVYSPLMDIKEYPHGVDIVLVEGAVSNQDNLEMARLIRERTRVVVCLGDCACNGNVTALRNPLEPKEVLLKSYAILPEVCPAAQLLPKVLPLHQVIPVEAFIPGCPPDPSLIQKTLRDVQDRFSGFIAPQR
jgi:NAD-reducing hydrogenase small subunit